VELFAGEDWAEDHVRHEAVNGTNEMDAKRSARGTLHRAACRRSRLLLREAAPVEIGVGDDRWQRRSALAQSTSRI
jgi:hypothetical protein